MEEVNQRINQALEVVTDPGVDLSKLVNQQQNIGELRAFQYIQNLARNQIIGRQELIQQLES